MNLKKIAAQVGIYLYFRLYIYGIWSWAYRALFERQFIFKKVAVYPSLTALSMRMKNLKWMPDTYRQLGDVISSPGRVEAVLSGEIEQPFENTDCDEFAVYLTNAIERSLTDPECPIQQNEPHLEKAEMLTIMWGGKKYEGHNVCLLTYDDGDKKSYCYMDYGMPSPHVGSVKEVVQQVLKLYAPDSYCLGWAISNKNVLTKYVKIGL